MKSFMGGRVCIAGVDTLDQSSHAEPGNMKKSPPSDKQKDSLASLRRKAEEKRRTQLERLHKLSARDIQELVHELGTHQIELEMQNEELRKARNELESSRNQYAELYDFAPVGY